MDEIDPSEQQPQFGSESDDLSPGIDPDSAAARIALRKVSKNAHRNNIRSLSFEAKVEVAGEEGTPENEELDWGTRDSAGAKLAARKASKNKVYGARRLSTGASELEIGEDGLPREVAGTTGVNLDRRSSEVLLQRSESKRSTGSRDRRSSAPDLFRTDSKGSRSAESDSNKSKSPKVRSRQNSHDWAVAASCPAMVSPSKENQDPRGDLSLILELERPCQVESDASDDETSKFKSEATKNSEAQPSASSQADEKAREETKVEET